MQTTGKVLLLIMGGCSEEQSMTGEQETSVAFVANQAGKTRLAFTAAPTQARLPEVVAGLQPRDFHWVMFTIDSTRYEEVKSPNGLRLDFAQSNGASFEQAYIGPCNPAEQNYNNCILYENIVGGATGVKGDVGLRINSRFEGDYDITIEGQTDRFGEPTQWHKHQSLGNVIANLAQVPQ
ncbi:MAG: hypothetical protein M4D80_40280 [Myxococcota bacterium]|nr:hypothetical protein [Myxococcota bacterium]